MSLSPLWLKEYNKGLVTTIHVAEATFTLEETLKHLTLVAKPNLKSFNIDEPMDVELIVKMSQIGDRSPHMSRGQWLFA